MEAPSMKRPLFLPIALALLTTACAIQHQAPLIPRRVLFDNPAKTDPQISPDGKYLSYLAPDRNDVLQIWLRSVHGNDDRQLSAESKRGIRHYTWSYDTRHLLFARETDGDENWQIIAIDMESGRMRNLTPYPGVRSLLVGMSPTRPETVLIAMNLRNRRLFDIYRIDIESGETRMVNRNGGAQSWWAADDQLNVRIAAAFAGTIVRDRQGQPWKVARKWHPGEQSRYIGLSADGQTFFMSGSYNGEQSALLAINLTTGEETAIASDPQYDVEDALLDPISHKIQAVSFYKEKLEWQVLDQGVAADFAVLSKLRDGEMTVLHVPYESPIVFSNIIGRRDLSDCHWIVTYEYDDRSIEHYLYDRASKTATFLFNERPRLTDFTLAKMRPISYPSRDGLTIHGYLTLPERSVMRGLPVVLYVHGGPQLRDRWGFHETVQWLANRGYAVLQVNYRGSTGYGRKFVHAGYKEWGGKMHDDLIDGVNWLVKQGIADPHRIAINGCILRRILGAGRLDLDTGGIRRRRQQRRHQQFAHSLRHLSTLLVQSAFSSASRRSRKGCRYAESAVAAVSRRSYPSTVVDRSRRQRRPGKCS
jgi:dipeptidyl aminopeptidase/acylaminoacyl peptidase